MSEKHRNAQKSMPQSRKLFKYQKRKIRRYLKRVRWRRKRQQTGRRREQLNGKMPGKHTEQQKKRELPRKSVCI